MHILSYNKGSASAKNLAEALGIKRIREEGSRYRAAPHKIVINWGCSNILPVAVGSRILNMNAKNAQNKLQAFKLMSEGVDIPEWTESREDALQWILEGKRVVCRTILNGHSGNGIIIADSVESLVDAPLYVRYISKKDEYRIHVMNGEVFHVQRKARNKDIPDENVNWLVRNHANGFIFAVNDVNPPDPVLRNAVAAVDKLKLDFGAVDVIWNDKKQQAYVLEVNTAPGLEGVSLQRYKEAFQRNYG